MGRRYQCQARGCGFNICPLTTGRPEEIHVLRLRGNDIRSTRTTTPFDSHQSHRWANYRHQVLYLLARSSTCDPYPLPIHQVIKSSQVMKFWFRGHHQVYYLAVARSIERPLEISNTAYPVLPPYVSPRIRPVTRTAQNSFIDIPVTSPLLTPSHP